MSREPDERPDPLTPKALAELEGLICQRLGGRLRYFRLSIREASVAVEASRHPADDESMSARAAVEFLPRAPTAPRTIGQ